MEQILAAFGYGITQDCFGLINTLGEHGLSHNDFLKFVEKSKKKNNNFVKKQTKKEKPKNNIFLKPGETVLLPGVVCGKCNGEVYIEGLCRHNPLVKQGFVRRGICGNCGAEFNIR
jgi:hypothetical protein